MANFIVRPYLEYLSRSDLSCYHSCMNKPFHYLYHIYDPESSAGFGFDGYVGITDQPKRRKGQHMGAAAQGRHPNPRFQKLYDDAKGNLQMSIVRRGTLDEVSASEALVINRPNKHANQQKGGGRLRGLAQEELLSLSGLGNKDKNALEWRPNAGTVSPQQAALIAAAAVAISAGACYAYHRFRKSGAGQDDVTEPKTAAPEASTNSLAERRARLARLEAHAEQNRQINIPLLAHLTWAFVARRGK